MPALRTRGQCAAEPAQHVSAPQNDSLAVRFESAVSLARELDFDAPQPQHFGAPRASSQAYRNGSFEADVARGGSCNCRSITLIPHCNGTHTESVGHLTKTSTPLHRFVPLAPIPALLLSIGVVDVADSNEDSLPAPLGHDQLLTASALRAAWPRNLRVPARALMLRTTGVQRSADNPPYLSRQAAQEIVARGIEHLVLDLPSADRCEDQGYLTAHRIFFGLPPGSTEATAATRGQCTITELAQFPSQLPDGPCALLLQMPAFTGDAVPSRPVYLPLAAGS
jgi:arylformamidase